MKELGVVGLLIMQGIVEPLGHEPDVIKYAITQGGLLLVVLVLLWFIRTRWEAESKRKDDRLEALTALVVSSTTALTKNNETSERLARAVENLNGRRVDRR